jgi:hypothetical protein
MHIHKEMWQETRYLFRTSLYLCKVSRNTSHKLLLHCVFLISKNKIEIMLFSCFLCVCPSSQKLSNYWTNLHKTRYLYHGIWFHPNCMLIPPVDDRLLSKHVTAAANIHTPIQELLETSFVLLFVSYQRKVGHQFIPEYRVHLNVHKVNTNNNQNNWISGHCPLSGILNN